MSQLFYIPSLITHSREDGTKDIFTCLEKIGQGGSAVIYKVKHQNSNKDYAMKIISKQFIISMRDKSTLANLKNEIQIHKILNHPNIVKSKLTFSDEFNYYIVLEYCPGKNIREYLTSSHHGHLSEPETRKILKDILSGLIYIHNHNIIHYDLKLENFLIGSDGKVKIADFGLSNFLKKDKKKSYYVCGTPNYISPEILLKKDYGNSFSSDIWSIGISAFFMLTGKPPFSAANKDIIYNNIKNCNFHFPSELSISFEAKDFVKSILIFDPAKRPSASDLLKHSFMRKTDSDQIQLYINPIHKVRQQPKSTQFNINQNKQNMHERKITINTNSQNSDLNKIESPHKKSILNTLKNKKNFCDQQKNFLIPNNFVVKHSFLRDDMVYLLANGTVGICFNDKSRIVLDPNEEFVQYYKNQYSQLGFINLSEMANVKRSIDEKISLVKKFAIAFKKSTNLFFDKKRKDTIPSIPLYHVSSFIKKNGSVLYRFSNKNVQVDFDDGKKLILFSNAKKMCLSSNLKEKCVLYNQSDVSRMSAKSDEFVKYKKTKEMLNELARSFLA